MNLFSTVEGVWCSFYLLNLKYGDNNYYAILNMNFILFEVDFHFQIGYWLFDIGY